MTYPFLSELFLLLLLLLLLVLFPRYKLCFCFFIRDDPRGDRSIDRPGQRRRRRAVVDEHEEEGGRERLKATVKNDGTLPRERTRAFIVHDSNSRSLGRFHHSLAPFFLLLFIFSPPSIHVLRTLGTLSANRVKIPYTRL